MHLVVKLFCRAHVARDALEAIAPTASANGNAVRIELGDTLGKARNDQLKFKQCLINLLSNAVKFTRDGEVTLAGRRERLEGMDWIVFEVSDTGIGMNAEQMARLFQPFVQADLSTTRSFGGTGLGLTITRRLARLMGGDVCVTSAPGKGSTFTLRILAERADEIGEALAPEPLAGPKDGPLVVVLEDDSNARDIARRALTQVGFSVWATASGAEGLRKIRESAPSLVLLDLNLQEMSGWDVLRELRGDRMPIIVFSSESERERTIELGACEHLVKPVERSALVATALRFARNSPQMAQEALRSDAA
jgi:CheY-like chemotaxis protein